MPRYVAFLRGVMPTNAKMPQLKACFESAGFANVKTVLGSGNVVFDAASVDESTLERKAEAAMQAGLGRSFYTIVRQVDHLQTLLESRPFDAYAVAPTAKRVVSFFRTVPVPKVALPLESDGARVLHMAGREAFTAYTPSTNGPVFMKLLEQAFGKDITTRTWETVEKCVAA